MQLLGDFGALDLDRLDERCVKYEVVLAPDIELLLE
jgi:hypothetical protein